MTDFKTIFLLTVTDCNNEKENLKILSIIKINFLLRTRRKTFYLYFTDEKNLKSVILNRWFFDLLNSENFVEMAHLKYF